MSTSHPNNQYAISPSNRVYSYAGLAVSSLSSNDDSIVIASTVVSYV